MTNPRQDRSQPVDEAQIDLTPEEIAAVRAALASARGGAAIPASTPAWLAARTPASGDRPFAGARAAIQGENPSGAPLAPWLTPPPVVPRTVVPLATTGITIRDGAMRNRPPLAGRRRADALPTRALAAAAGVAVTLGLVVVLVPPDTMVPTGAQGSVDPGGDASASADQGVALVSPSDVVESAAPSPVPAASKAGKAKGTPKPARAAATPRPVSGGSSGGTSGGSTATARPVAKATPRPTNQATAQPTAQPKPQPTPQPTPPPTPKPTPVPTAASGKT